MIAQSTIEAIPVRIADVQVVDAYNPRKAAHRILTNEETVQHYVEMLEHSEPPPILVNQDMELLDGAHRLEAARKTGAETIPAIVQNTENAVDALFKACIPNVMHGRILSPNERRIAARKLVKGGFNADKIAQGFGCSPTTVRKWVSDEAKELIEAWVKSDDPQKLLRTEFAAQHDLSIALLTAAEQRVARGKTNEDLITRCKWIAEKRKVLFFKASQSAPYVAWRDKTKLLRFAAGRVFMGKQLKSYYDRGERMGVVFCMITSDSDFEDLLDEIQGVKS